MDKFYSYDKGFSSSPDNRPHFHCVPDYWDHILKGNDYRVFQFLYFHISDIVASNSKAVAKLRNRVNGGVWCMTDLIVRRTGLSMSTVDRALASLESTGLILKVNRPEHAKFELRRVFFINHVLLARLDRAWMNVQTKEWHESYDTYEEYEDALQNAVEVEWSNIRAEGREAAIEALSAMCGGNVGVPLILRGTPPHFDVPSKIDSEDRLLEVSSSKIPGPFADERTSAASPIESSRRRVPQGLLSTPQATPAALFKRNGGTTSNGEAAPAADTRIADSLLDYWNNALPHKKQSKHKRSGEVNTYYKAFVTKMDKLLRGTLFVTDAIDPKYRRKFSVADVQRAIDKFASYPPNLQDSIKYIGDFLMSDAPNKPLFRNGCGRSWMLRCLFCDDPYTPAPLEDKYPDVTEHIRTKYLSVILKGQTMPFDTIDRNNMVKAAALVMELYYANEESLSRLNQTPEVIVNKLMEHAGRWNRNGATTPSTLCQPALFKALVVELTKNGYLRQDDPSSDETSTPMGRAGDMIEDTRTPDQKERDHLRAIVLAWPETVREDMMKARNIPLDILD